MREIVISEKEIDLITTKCAKELKEKFKDNKKAPILIGVLKGAMPFMMDLIKKCDFDLEEDFIQVSSYNGTASTGVVHLKKDVSEDIKDRDIVLIEDIIDTGLTLSYLKQYLKLNFINVIYSVIKNILIINYSNYFIYFIIQNSFFGKVLYSN